MLSRDGKTLVWRANYPKTPEDTARYRALLADNLTAPMKMEIMIHADGGNARAITNFGCASFAPTFSPDGKTLVFCSDHDAKDRYEFNIFTAAWRD